MDLRIIAFVLLLSAPRARAPEVDLPRFESYSVEDIYTGPLAPVDISSPPIAREYRTRLREGASKGPNFAGHYTIVQWGCGSGCGHFAIVDAITGKVHYPRKVSNPLGLAFRLESRLLVLDPPEIFLAGLDGCPDHVRAWDPVAKYYYWQNDTLTRVKDVTFCPKPND